MEGITFPAILTKAATTVDGGWNLTFSVGGDQARTVLQLCQLRDTLVQVGIVQVTDSDDTEDFHHVG